MERKSQATLRMISPTGKRVEKTFTSSTKDGRTLLNEKRDAYKKKGYKDAGGCSYS